MENLIVSTKKKFTMDKFFSQVKVVATDDIERVLNVSAKTIFGGAEISNGVLIVSGKSVVNVIYLNVEGRICSADAFYDFIQKQKFDSELGSLVLTDETIVESVDFSGNEVVCSLGYEPCVEGEYKYQMPSFENSDGELVTERNMIKNNKLICSPEDSFSVAEEFETNRNNVQILAENSKAVLDEISCTVDKVVIEGKVVCEIIAKDDTEIFVINREFEFRQEIAAEKIIPNMFASCNLSINNVKVTPEVRDDKTIIVSTFDIFAKCFVYEESSIDVVTDIFSLNSNLDVIYDYVEAHQFVNFETLNDSVLSQTNIAEIPDFDDIIGVYSPEAKLKTIEEKNDKFFVAGEISAFALYRSTSGTKKLNISHEVNFEIEKKENLELNDVNIRVMITSFKVKAGKELEVVFAVDYRAEYTQNVTTKYVKKYEVKTQKTADNYGVRVYITKSKQTLFEVAKILNIKPEVIEAQNVVDGEFELGQKIYVYSPINLA